MQGRFGWRWLLVVLRAFGWVLAFALVIIPHLFASALGRRNLFPPPFLGVLCRISGVRVSVQGKPARGALLLANHLSWIDILALAGTCQTAFVAHSGLAIHPVFKWLCEQNGTVFITRDARGTVHRQVNQVAENLGHRRLTIFPEATTGDGKALLPFRSSLLSAVERLPQDIVVQPVALKYSEAQAIAWVGDEPGLANMCRIFARLRRVDLVIAFLQPLQQSEMTDRKAMAAAAQERIAAHLPG